MGNSFKTELMRIQIDEFSDRHDIDLQNVIKYAESGNIKAIQKLCKYYTIKKDVDNVIKYGLIGAKYDDYDSLKCLIYEYFNKDDYLNMKIHAKKIIELYNKTHDINFVYERMYYYYEHIKIDKDKQFEYLKPIGREWYSHASDLANIYFDKKEYDYALLYYRIAYNLIMNDKTIDINILKKNTEDLYFNIKLCEGNIANKEDLLIFE
jgi:hypothetical protein